MDSFASRVEGIRRDVYHSSPNLIREIAELCYKRGDALMLCFGESDEPTPRLIIDSLNRALEQKQTFYTPNNGVPALCEALADYMSRWYELPIAVDRITATASGMSAITLVLQALIAPGDEVVVVGPVWPNIRGVINVMSGVEIEHSLAFGDNGWQLDLQALFDCCTPKTRAIFFNSPGNPTGWTATREELETLLAFSRERGIWLVADDVYARITYDVPIAPSVIQLAEPEDRVIAINSFSKTWSMTGWRLGWLTAPPNLLEVFAKLNEFNIAAPTTFVQHAGITALDASMDDEVDAFVQRLKTRRDLISSFLDDLPRVHYREPAAALYAYFAVEGIDDSMAFAEKLLNETGVVLAPGAAFGQGQESYLRLCFAKSEQVLAEACDRLRLVLG